MTSGTEAGSRFAPPFRIAVDTGGTFTDVVLVDRHGRTALGKALTTPARAFDGVGEGLTRLAGEIGWSRADLLSATDTFIYGTTRSTNAVVEKTMARTALLTTRGFPDVLLLKEGGKPDPFRQMTYPDPFVPRRLTFEIDERIDADGGVFRPLDEDSVRTALRAARAAGCEAIAVCLIWSIANAGHEERVGELIEEVWPEVPYTLSHRLNPIIREYRRASSTAIDASLKPLMQGHLRGLAEDLGAAGFHGHLLVATSFGGTWPLEEMIDRPIYSIGSGPSLAPVAARAYAEAEAVPGTEHHRDLLVCDTGGTTFDVGIVSDGQITYTNETWLGGRWIGEITGTRAVDVTSIGSGGGSVIWIDPGGLLRVGPHSAGSEPGPACYGRGGTQPTVTDACLVLGYLDPDYFLGGRMPLDVGAARKAVGERIADPLGLTLEEAAWAALVVAGEDIVGAIRAKTVSQGIDPRDMLIIAGGGASGLTIGRIARELGSRRALIPRTAGALSACGGIYSDIVSEFPVAGFADTGRFDSARVAGWLAEARRRGQAFLDSLGDLPTLATELSFSVEARYRLQAWELDVPLEKAEFSGPQDVRDLERAFDAVHEKVFSVAEPGQHLECLVWKARATATLPKPGVEKGERATEVVPATKPMPAVFDGRTWPEVPQYNGSALPLGSTILGPAIVREPTTTIVVYPGQELTVTPNANYLLDTGATGREHTEDTR